MEIRRFEREKQPLFAVDFSLSAALATYCKVTWPANTVKNCARFFDLSIDAARNVVAGRASMRSLNDIAKHRNGGLAVLLPVVEAAANQTTADFIQSERKRLASEQERTAANDARLGQMARDLPAVLGLRDLRRAGVGDEPQRERTDVGRRRVPGRN